MKKKLLTFSCFSFFVCIYLKRGSHISNYMCGVHLGSCCPRSSLRQKEEIKTEDKMITVKKHTPERGDYFQPSTSVRKLFKGKFEAWYLYEEFISNTEIFLKERTKKDLMKSTGLSERKWDKAISDLQEMGFLDIETSYAKESFGKIYHFSSTPEKKNKQIKESKFTKEEWEEIQKLKNVKINENIAPKYIINTSNVKEVDIELYKKRSFNEDVELPF